MEDNVAIEAVLAKGAVEGAKIAAEALPAELKPLGKAFHEVFKSDALEKSFSKALEKNPILADEAGKAGDSKVRLSQLRGKAIENTVHEVLSNYIEQIDTQKTAYDDKGDRHYTDLEGTAKEDIVISRTDMVKKGEKISVEIKTGKPAYLESEIKSHALDQAKAHEGKSIILTSQDFYDLPLQKQQDLRALCRENNTMIVAGLPRVDVMDACFTRAISQLDSKTVS